MIKKYLWSFALCLLFFVMMIVIVVGAGIYRFNWSGPFTSAFAKAIPFPAAIVNGRVVTVSRLFQVSAAYKKLIVFQSGSEVSVDNHSILRRLIDNEVTRQLAQANKVAVTETELDDYYGYVLKKIGVIPDEAEGKIRKIFGLSEKQFKDLLVRPDLLRQKLQIFYFDLGKANNLDYKLAEELLDDIKTGKKSFEQVAETRSEDQKTGYLSGDMGFLNFQNISPWLSVKASSMDINAISDVITTPEGFVILNLVEKSETNEVPLLHFKNILIKSEPLMDDVIREEISRSRVYVMKN